MSIELAKKYGFVASMINIIMPIVAFVIVGVFYYQVFYQLFTGSILPSFWQGAVSSFSLGASVVSFIGFVLFLLSMYKLSNYYKEPKIFRNVLYGFLTTLIGGIILIVIVVGLIIASITSPLAVNTVQSVVLSIIGILIAIVTVSIIISIINGVFVWQAFNKLGEKSDVESFKTAGTLYLIGSVLTIMFGLGAILIWLSWIYAAKSFQKLQPQPTDKTTINNTVTSTGTTTTISGKIYCSFCGIENDPINSSYCKQCGKPLHTNQTTI